MSVHTFCLSSRRATARLKPDGDIEYRTDPQWFTPYHRRETVTWDGAPESDIREGASASVIQEGA